MSKAKMQECFLEAGRLMTQAKSILEAYTDDMPQDKANEVDALFDAAELKTAEGQRYERALEMEQRLNAPVNRLETPIIQAETEPDTREARSHLDAFRKALVHGPARLTTAELKTLSATDETEGGFLLAPESVASGIIQEIDNMVYVRQFATTYNVAASGSLGVVTLDTDIDDATWTSELDETDVTATIATGKRELRTNRLTKGTKISRRLIRQARQNVESLVQARLAYKFAVSQEKAFLTGTGDKQPLGLFVASAMGIPASRDTTASANTSFTAENLIDTKYSLKAQYLQRARWLVHRDALKMTRKLKTGDGEYIWMRGLAQDRPDTLLDVPYLVSEYAPNTFTTGQYVALLGDLSFYWIADSLEMTIQVLLEKYALTNETGYIANMECDGMPVLSAAFARLKLA